MNKKYVVRLTPEERASLEDIVSKGSAAAKKIVHAQVLLKIDADGPHWTDEQAADSFSVNSKTVRTIRQRFVEEGLEPALNRKKRDCSSHVPLLDGAAEARLIATACGPAPKGRARWTLRLLANRLVELKVVESVSYETVRVALKKTS